MKSSLKYFVYYPVSSSKFPIGAVGFSGLVILKKSCIALRKCPSRMRWSPKTGQLFTVPYELLDIKYYVMYLWGMI